MRDRAKPRYARGVKNPAGQTANPGTWGMGKRQRSSWRLGPIVFLFLCSCISLHPSTENLSLPMPGRISTFCFHGRSNVVLLILLTCLLMSKKVVSVTYYQHELFRACCQPLVSPVRSYVNSLLSVSFLACLGFLGHATCSLRLVHMSCSLSQRSTTELST